MIKFELHSILLPSFYDYKFRKGSFVYQSGGRKSGWKNFRQHKLGWKNMMDG